MEKRHPGTSESTESLPENSNQIIEDQPMVLRSSDGRIHSRIWYQGDELHREDEPAVIRYHPDGSIESERWYREDQLHREGD